jgi:hypothetical protein
LAGVTGDKRGPVVPRIIPWREPLFEGVGLERDLFSSNSPLT